MKISHAAILEVINENLDERWPVLDRHGHKIPASIDEGGELLQDAFGLSRLHAYNIASVVASGRMYPGTYSTLEFLDYIVSPGDMNILNQPKKPTPAELRRQAEDDEQDLQSVATHEAGHVAVILELGGVVHEVIVEKDSGHVRWSGEFDAYKNAIVCWAGSIADGRRLDDEQCRSDRRRLIAGLRQSTDDARGYRGPTPLSDEQLLEGAVMLGAPESARNILDERRRFVGKLARRLMRDGRADGSTVRLLWDESI